MRHEQLRPLSDSVRIGVWFEVLHVQPIAQKRLSMNRFTGIGSPVDWRRDLVSG